MRLIQALQGDVLLSPSCKISYFSLPGVHYNRYTCILLGYGRGGGGGEGYSHDSKVNAFMTS